MDCIIAPWQPSALKNLDTEGKMREGLQSGFFGADSVTTQGEINKKTFNILAFWFMNVIFVGKRRQRMLTVIVYVLPVVLLCVLFILEHNFLANNHDLNADSRGKLASLPAVQELSAILNPPRFDANFSHLQQELSRWVQTHSDWPFAASDNTRFATPFNFRNFLETFEHFSVAEGRFMEMREILDADLLKYLLTIARRCRTIDVARSFIAFQALLQLRHGVYSVTNTALQACDAGRHLCIEPTVTPT